jgi:hypothetical protein
VPIKTVQRVCNVITVQVMSMTLFKSRAACFGNKCTCIYYFSLFFTVSPCIFIHKIFPSPTHVLFYTILYSLLSYVKTS